MIIEMLGVGERNARTQNELTRVLQKDDTREIRQAIRTERLAGNIICSNDKGYFLPENDADIKATIRRLRKRSKAFEDVADAMQMAFNQRSKKDGRKKNVCKNDN